ncbi:MAG: type II toxin-antitoxin system RelB/DinJ family antitoxin [Firmicutes bacterium]|nr:type II toxin-antitoxin system RelB/DinJ family antitoxin [Bacillota bacterium]
MAQTSVSIRIDEDLKKQFDAFCNDVGMTMTTAFCIFAKTVVREQRIPFIISRDVPNAETLAALEEVKEMKAHPEEYKGYTDVDEMMKELLA